MLGRVHISFSTAGDQIYLCWLLFLLLGLVELRDCLNVGKVHMLLGALSIKVDKLAGRWNEKSWWVLIKTRLPGVVILLSSCSHPEDLVFIFVVEAHFSLFVSSPTGSVGSVVKDIHGWVAVNYLGNCHLADVFRVPQEGLSGSRLQLSSGLSIMLRGHYIVSLIELWTSFLRERTWYRKIVVRISTTGHIWPIEGLFMGLAVAVDVPSRYLLDYWLFGSVELKSSAFHVARVTARPAQMS